MKYNLASKTLAGIVTYNPDITRLQQNIEAVIQNGIKKIVIIDNNSNNNEAIRELTGHIPIVNTINNNNNEGIAYALNQIFQEAEHLSFEWVLTLDQDSVIDDDMLASYEQFYTGEETVVSLTTLRRDRNYDVKQKHSDDSIEYVGGCVTSGNLVKVSAWRSIGGFDNRLFIDLVDYDFCLRLREHGYKILRVNKTCILHELGKPTTVMFCGKERVVQNYSALRKYYITRNSVYLQKTSSLYPMADCYSGLFRIFFKTILFEKEDKRNKICSMIKGFFDGLRMERIQLEQT